MTDLEYTDSEYDSEYDSDDNEYTTNNVIYDAEEENMSRFNISLCELYNPLVHGEEQSTVLYHYLVHTRFKYLDIDYINNMANNINNEYIYLLNPNHSIFRNYRQIITQDNYVKPEIVECIYLETGHCVAIIKTLWIKLIQRTWKNILRKKEFITRKRRQVNSIIHRELTGKWPIDCLTLPTLKGMLLKN